jgi:hypothetical protein
MDVPQRIIATKHQVPPKIAPVVTLGNIINNN